MKCANCGNELPDDAKFCGNCGCAAIVKEVKTEKKKKRLGLYLIIAALIIAAIIAAVVMNIKKKEIKRNYDAAVADGIKYLEELDYEQAETAYLNAIAIDPKKKEPYIQLADIYLQKREYDKAQDIINQGMEQVGKEEELIEESEKVEEIINLPSWEWVKEPYLAAENIDKISLSRPDYTEKSRGFLEDGLYEMTQNGKKGIIDIDGNVIANSEYDSIMIGYDEQYLLVKGQREQCYTFDESMNLLTAKDPSRISGTAPHPKIMWDTDRKQLMVLTFRDSYGERDAVQVDGLIGVVALPSEPDWSSEEHNEWGKGIFSNKKIVCYNGKPITEAIYDACGFWDEKLIGVCVDGKWGFLNASGEMVIPAIYEASWIEPREESGSAYIDYGTSYRFTEGYVVLKMDGQYQLQNESGSEVIKPGEFDAIRPVDNGKCWVKKDGLWGIIKLLDKNNLKPDDSSDTNQTEEAEEKTLLVKYSQYDTEGKLLGSTEYAYDEYGNPTGEKRYNSYGDLSEEKRFTSFGEVAERISYLNGEISSIYECFYDENERVVKEESKHYTNDNGDSIYTGGNIWEWTYEGDNIAHRKGYNKSESGTRYDQKIDDTYDLNGNLIRQDRYFIENGQETYAYSTEYIYNDQGKCIQEIGDGGGYVEYKYDDRGNMIEKAYYDADGSFSESFKSVLDEKDNIIEQIRCTSDGIEKTQSTRINEYETIKIPKKD